MRANTKTLLSLYEFARILEIEPLHFAGVDLPELASQHPHCSAQAWVQYGWQAGDRTSRDAVARAISEAEQRMATALGFDVLPDWHVDERHNTIRPFNRNLFNVTGRRVGGWANTVQLNRGFYVEGGCRRTTAAPILPQVVDPPPSPVNVFWQDAGYWMTGEVWATVPAGTVACNVHIYYPGKGPAPTWEIRPATVEIAGTTAVITIPRECAVKAELWETIAPRAASGTDDGDFLDDFDVFVEDTDPSCQATFYWEASSSSCMICSGVGCSACVRPTQPGCLGVQNERLAIVGFHPATWNETTLVFDSASFSPTRQPDVVAASYLAGYQDMNAACPRRQMSTELAQAVAYFAASLLERPLCACNVDAWRTWRQDPNEDSHGARFLTSVQVTPFGTRKGALYAWETVRNIAIGRGVALVP